MSITIYHNPRCSKSRTALSILEEHQVQIDTIDYMKSPPAAETLRAILAKLGGPAKQLLRQNEKEYKELSLAQADDEEIVAAIAANPNLLQRPIVVSAAQAVIGRPPEKVLTVL